MDGVLVNFQSGIDKLTNEDREKYKREKKNVPHIFSKMEPIEGAVEAFNILSGKFSVFILSTSPWNNETAPGDKLKWVKKYLGEPVYKRLILSHHKQLNDGHYLIDDRPHKNGAGNFKGELIHFGSERYPNWKAVLY